MFGKKKVTISSPLEGKIIPLEEVPDEVFSEKMLGDGFAVIPSNSRVCSPVDGTISLVFKTLHAIGLKTKEGVELLIHVGLETVSMEESPFESQVKEGDVVKRGDLLITADFSKIEAAEKSPITPVIITNMESVKDLVHDFTSLEKTVVATVK